MLRKFAFEFEMRLRFLAIFRPYSVIQVFENLHQRVSKPVVERTLNALCEEGGDLCVKEYGKAKIYFPDQVKICLFLILALNSKPFLVP
jgi:hypothetical protein